MSHELEFQNGRANMFSVIETPWHREGTILTEAPSYDDALRIANLNYIVEKRPTFLMVTNPKTNEQVYRRSKFASVTVKKGSKHELGMVGPGYTVLQNADAFRALTPLVDSGVVQLETGGVLREGADAWLMGRFNIEKFGPVVREVFADEVVPYCLFTNNHSGRRAATVALTPVRVVCANTLGMAETDMDRMGRAVKVTHTESAATRMVEGAEALLKGIVERYEAIANQYRLLKSTFLPEEVFQSLVIDAVIEDPRKKKTWNPEAKLAEMVVDRYTRKVTEVTRLWDHGKGHTGDQSAWEAYNGVVEAIDHNSELFPARNGINRTASLTHGILREKKATVLSNLVSYAQGQSSPSWN